MSTERNSIDRSTSAATFQRALAGARPGPHCLLLVMGGLLTCFLVPSITLCGFVRGVHIAWTIAAVTAATGLTYLAVAYRMEARQPDQPRIAQLLMAGVLMIAAGALYASMLLPADSLRTMALRPLPAMGISVVAIIAGVLLVVRHARRVGLAAANA